MPVVGRLKAPGLVPFGKNCGFVVVRGCRQHRIAKQKSGAGFRTAPLKENNCQATDRSRSAFTARSDGELVESKFGLAGVGNVLEQLRDNAVEVSLADRIEVVLAVSAATDQACLTQQGQVMADSRLALLQSLAQRRDMQFVFAVQVHQHSQPSLIGEQFEHLDQLTLELAGELILLGNGFFLTDGRFNKFEHFFPNAFCSWIREGCRRGRLSREVRLRMVGQVAFLKSNRVVPSGQ